MNAAQFKRLQERRRIAEAHAAKIIRDAEKRESRKARKTAKEATPEATPEATGPGEVQ